MEWRVSGGRVRAVRVTASGMVVACGVVDVVMDVRGLCFGARVWCGVALCGVRSCGRGSSVVCVWCQCGLWRTWPLAAVWRVTSCRVSWSCACGSCGGARGALPEEVGKARASRVWGVRFRCRGLHCMIAYTIIYIHGKSYVIQTILSVIIWIV